jgi:hypothetical protein
MIVAKPRAQSVPRRPCADRARVGIHVAASAEVVALAAVRIGLLVWWYVSARARYVALDRMAVRIRTSPVILSLRASCGKQQRCSKKDFLHSQSPHGFIEAPIQPWEVWRRLRGVLRASGPTFRPARRYLHPPSRRFRASGRGAIGSGRSVRANESENIL